MEVVTSWEVLLNAGNTAQFLSRAPGNIHAILTCIHNMSGTNSFMTMTINRCLDYTKATQGFRLVPKHETLPLRPVLEMPMKMMSDVQQAIEIRLLPWDPVICTHVVTDKQWLLENLLCLLSNAVKYSLRGHADIGVRLRDSNGEDVADPEPILLRRTCSYMPSVEDPEVLLQFEVQDTGIGLSEEAIQMLFNPFKQAQRMAGGTGLGLFSLAKRVEALHGQYGVCSRPDGQQGSLFCSPYPTDPTTSAQSWLAPPGTTTRLHQPTRAPATDLCCMCRTFLSVRCLRLTLWCPLRHRSTCWWWTTRR
jgi:signal transduction histidine kinase